MISPELLSPAGDWDCLKAAVREGADSVYLGVERFNARRRAENFKETELASVVGFCHDRGVKAYLAVNTLVKNSELGGYFGLLERAYSAGVDAVILQEFSFAPILKENLPDMGVHVSTQAGVFNSYYYRVLDGVDRVILPREFTLNQVRDFIGKTGIPVEVFVQGALCFSVSGQCLMSSLLGSRSGNRGLCAQPCRKRYNRSYLLSTRDLCVVDKLSELVGAGVAGLKIEGRLRSPEYVGAATALYRRALDEGRLDEDAFADMRIAFNREYSHGALFKEYDVVTEDVAGKRGIYLGRMQAGGLVKLEAEVMVGDGVGIHTHGRIHGDVVKVMHYNGREVSRGIPGQTVKLFVNAKKGDEVVLTSGVRRRKPASIASGKKIIVERIPKTVVLPKIKTETLEEVKFLVKTYSVKCAREALDEGAARAYYSVFERDYPGGEVGAYVPRCLSEWNAEKALNLLEMANPQSVLCGDLGVATQLKGREVYFDMSCNAFNDLDVSYSQSLGLTPVISPELSLSELGGFRDKRFAVYAHGRIPLMTTKYVLKEDKLKDEKRYTFPVRGELECRQILNSVPLGLYGDVLKLKSRGIKEFLLDLEDNARETVSTYQRILKGERIKKPRGYTLGNYCKGVF